MSVLKKVLALTAVLCSGALAGLVFGLLLSHEHRERLSRQVAVPVRGIVEHGIRGSP
jgi:hypothetical protein